MHEGDVGESSTLEGAVERVTARFGIERVVFVGDRAMITEARCEELKRRGLDFITALRAPRIQAPRDEGALRLSSFDERDLAEIGSEEFPGERLVVCRDPAVASERARRNARSCSA